MHPENKNIIDNTVAAFSELDYASKLKAYNRLFSLGYIPGIENKFNLISLVALTTSKMREKNPKIMPLDILMKITGQEKDDTGFYQFFLRARGDKAGGAYPSIGIFVDKRFDFSTAGRLVSSTWHRTTLGIPIYLEKGSRQIALRFLNDFSVKEGIDRNLFLDSFEFTKIESKFTNNLLGLEVALLNNIHGKTVRDELGLQGRSKWNKEK